MLKAFRIHKTMLFSSPLSSRNCSLAFKKSRPISHNAIIHRAHAFSRGMFWRIYPHFLYHWMQCEQQPLPDREPDMIPKIFYAFINLSPQLASSTIRHFLQQISEVLFRNIFLEFNNISQTTRPKKVHGEMMSSTSQAFRQCHCFLISGPVTLSVIYVE